MGPISTRPDPADLIQFVELVQSQAPGSRLLRLSSKISRQLRDQRFRAVDLQRLICAICKLLDTSCDHSTETEFVSLLMTSAESLADTQQQPELIQSARAIVHLAKRHRFRCLLLRTRLLNALQTSALQPDQLSSLAWCLASGAHTREAPDAVVEDLLVQLLAATVDQLHNFSTFNISNTAWALAKMGGQKLRSHSVEVRGLCFDFFAAVEQSSGLEEFAADDLCGLSWAFSTAAVHPQPHFRDAIFLTAAARLGEQTNKNFVNLCWAAAGMRAVFSPPLLSSLIHDLRHRLNRHGFQGRDLAVLAWSFASLAHFECLPDILAASTEFENWVPQNLCNLLWAMARAKLGHHGQSQGHASDLGVILGAARRRLGSFTAHDLASFAWAIASLQVSAGVMLHAGNEATAKIDTFMPRDLASFAWALVALQHKQHPFLDAAVGQSLHVLHEFGGRDAANLTWAFALAHSEKLVTGRTGYSQALCSSLAARATAVPDLTSQSLSNLAWACAVLHVSEGDGRLRNRLWRSTMSMHDQLQLRDVASITWAFVMLVCEDAHLNTLVARACKLIDACARVEAHMDVRRRDCIPEASSVLTLLWAGSFAQRLGLKFSPLKLFLSGKEYLLGLGRGYDVSQPRRLPPLLACNIAKSPRGSTAAEPFIVHESSDLLAVYKPHGWEVDQGNSSGVRKLSSFLRSQFQVRCFPILKDSAHLHGFLHRLDVPSSGLILVAKAHEAFYHLMIQLHLGEIARDYIVLCHGWVAPSTHQIVASVLWSDSAGSSSPSLALASDLSGGKPSITKTKVLAHLMREQQSYSLVAIRIQTGRRHQIRAHLAHVGHPVVCDPKYERAAREASRSAEPGSSQGEHDKSTKTWVDEASGRNLAEADKIWCPRNFLHRYRLEFADVRSIHAIQAPLPEDLKQALLHLSPREGQHCQMSLAQLRGWQTNESMEDWDRLPHLLADEEIVE